MSETVLARELVLDDSMYPRIRVNTYNVSKYAAALRGGHTPPPVVADRVTRVVADGWHRIHAALAVFGDDATVPVEWRDYSDRKSLYVDSIRLNEHGQPLTGQERALVAQRLEAEFKLEPRAIAFVLQSDERAVLRLIPRWAEVPDGNGASGRYNANGAVRAALKHGTRHLRGQTLSPEQAAAHDHMAIAPARAISQVISALTGDLLNWEDKSTVERLCLLHRELTAALDLHGVRC